MLEKLLRVCGALLCYSATQYPPIVQKRLSHLTIHRSFAHASAANTPCKNADKRHADTTPTVIHHKSAIHSHWKNPPILYLDFAAVYSSTNAPRIKL